MPIGIKFSNFAFSTLAVGCNAAATSLALASGTGAKFPTLAAGEYFYATLENASLDREVVKVTARSTDTITVVRGQDNTTARSWNAGDSIALRLNAGALDDFKAEVVDATNLIRTSNNTFTGTNAFNTAPTFGTDLAIADGGTGAGTAATAFDNLKQAATDVYTGVVELATDAEAIAGTDTTRVLTPANLRAANIVAGTAQTAPASPTPLPYIDFTGIPSWAKRITIMFNGISASGASAIRIRCGSGSIQSSGYVGYNLSYSNTALAGTNISNGFDLAIGAGDTAAAVRHGVLTLSNITGNTWVANGSIGNSNNVYGGTVCGSVTLSGVLDRIRITTFNGTDTFDAGTVNILWE